MSVLELKHVNKVMNKKYIVDGVSFSLQEGTVTGFVGHNGAGKSTTMKIIMGLVQPSSGHVNAFGVSIKDKKVFSRIGYLPENPVYPDYLTGKEFLNYMADLYAIKGKNRVELVAQLLEKVGLSGQDNKLVKQYSKGMKQRLGIAQALLNDADLLILDEPMSGLDPIGRDDVLNLIKGLKSEGKTIILSSHILFDLEKVCSRYLLISNGKLIDDVSGFKGNLEELYLKKVRKDK